MVTLPTVGGKHASDTLSLSLFNRDSLTTTGKEPSSVFSTNRYGITISGYRGSDKRDKRRDAMEVWQGAAVASFGLFEKRVLPSRTESELSFARLLKDSFPPFEVEIHCCVIDHPARKCYLACIS